MARKFAEKNIYSPEPGLIQIRRKITYLNCPTATIVDVAGLPAYASVCGGGVHILTAFNDSGTDTLDVGFRSSSATTDDNAYATLLDLSAVGWIVLDELATTTNIISTQPSILTVRYNGQNSNATAGVAYLSVWLSIGMADGSD